MITEISMEVPVWQKLKDEIKKYGLKQEFIRSNLRITISQPQFSKMLNGTRKMPEDIQDQIWAILYKYK